MQQFWKKYFFQKQNFLEKNHHFAKRHTKRPTPF